MMRRCREVSPRLVRAYRRTIYRAGEAVVRVGDRCAAVDTLLARHHAGCAVFVTAWNPYSHRMPDGWNRHMQERLRQRLRRCVVLPACGGLGRWQEDHFLVLAPLPPVARWGRIFRQNAVVVIRRGEPARLHLLTGTAARATRFRADSAVS